MQEITGEIIQFTRQLVRIPSQTEIDGEAAVAKIVFEKLKSFGFEPKIIGPQRHPSVICHIQNPRSISHPEFISGSNKMLKQVQHDEKCLTSDTEKGGLKTVWLESCLDTVPAGDPKEWTHPPFTARIVDNKMYGRGVADSKVGIAIFCYLAKILVEDKNFDGSLFLGFDAAEQTGNFTGIKEVIKLAPKADICILGYQGINEISIGARGWLRLKLATFGEAAHTGSRTKRGVNAIHAMGKTIVALSALDSKEKTEDFFEFGPSVQISQIKGGGAINVVPDKCEVKIDIRLTPSQTKEGILEMIGEKLKALKANDPSFTYTIKVLQFQPAYLTDPQNQFVKILQATTRRVLGKDIPLATSGKGSVGNVIGKLGVPIINGFGCESDNVHAPNEWVNLESIPKIFDIYKQVMMEFSKI